MRLVTLGRLNDQVTYADELVAILRSAENKDSGTNYEEMATIIPLIRKIKNAVLDKNDKGQLLLEDAEFELLSRRIKSAPYQLNDENVFDLLNSVLNSPSHVAAVKDKTK